MPMKELKTKIHIQKKQYLRNNISLTASYLEIALSACIIVGILLFSVIIVKDILLIFKSLWLVEAQTIDIREFLSHTLQLIIGIEFVKMLTKHTPGSAVEVILFAISRKLIIDEHMTMLETLLGVVAIGVLFLVRKYLTSLSEKISEDERIFNGGTSVNEVNKLFHTLIASSLGNTLGGVIANSAKQRGEKIVPGYEIVVEGLTLRVQSMDDNLIKQVMVTRN